MAFVSVTRLRLRSIRYLPWFFWHSNRSIQQARQSQGNLNTLVRKGKGLAFWTLTVWESADDMTAYRNSGAHRLVMPKLVDWCDEAASAHWQQSDSTCPSWDSAAQYLKDQGRLFKVKYPSRDHQSGNISYF